MSVWLREIAGWFLVAVGLGCAGTAIYLTGFIEQKQPVSAIICVFVGFLTFRSGIQFLKVATAARAAREIRGQTAAALAPTKRVRPAFGAAGPPAGRQRASVLPGPTGDRGR